MDFEPRRTFPKKGGDRGKQDRRGPPARNFRGGRGRGRGGKNFNNRNRKNFDEEPRSQPPVFKAYESSSEDEGIQEIPTVNSGKNNRLQSISSQFDGYGYKTEGPSSTMNKKYSTQKKENPVILNVNYSEHESNTKGLSKKKKNAPKEAIDLTDSDEEEEKEMAPEGDFTLSDSEEEAIESDPKKRKIVHEDVLNLSDEDVDMDGEIEESDNEDEEMNDEESSEKNDEDEAANFRKEVVNLPMYKVRELRDQLGLKLFNKLYFTGEEGDKKEITSEKKKPEQKRMLNKGGQHRPREISSKKPVSSFREVYKNEKKVKKWDPRFDERAGTYREDRFMEDYEFLDEIRHSELKEMQHELMDAVESNDRKRALKLSQALEKMENRERARREKKLVHDTKAELRQQNIDRMLAGERPIYKKKSEVNMIIAEKKFEQLKKEKRLGKYMKNKVKKQAGKEKKKKAILG